MDGKVVAEKAPGGDAHWFDKIYGRGIDVYLTKRKAATVRRAQFARVALEPAGAPEQRQLQRRWRKPRPSKCSLARCSGCST